MFDSSTLYVHLFACAQILRHLWKELLLVRHGPEWGDAKKLAKIKDILLKQLNDLYDKQKLLQVLVCAVVCIC